MLLGVGGKRPLHVDSTAPRIPPHLCRSSVIGHWSAVMICDHRCSLCSLITLFSDVSRGPRGVLWSFVGSTLKSVGASDRFHGACLRAPRGVRELHKFVLEVLGVLVDVLASSMTSQEGRKTTNHCLVQCLEASTPPKLKLWRVGATILQTFVTFEASQGAATPSGPPMALYNLPNRWESGGRPFKYSKIIECSIRPVVWHAVSQEVRRICSASRTTY